MNDRLRFRAGFKVCYYDKDGNDKELLVKVNDCFAIENGGDAIIINEDIIKDFIKDLSTAEQNSVLEYMQANFDETNDYWFIDKLKYLDQCIGLKDKNGALIYGCDIVKITDKSSRKEPFIGVVEYTKIASYEANCNGLYMYLHNPKTPENISIVEKKFCTSLREIEVIGNIHENKELLK